MKFARSSRTLAGSRALVAIALFCAPALAVAHETGETHVHFQKPSGNSTAAASGSNSLRFRSGSTPKAVEQPAEKPASPPAAEQAPVEQATYAADEAKPLKAASRPVQTQAVAQIPAKTNARPAFAQPRQSSQLADYRIATASESNRVVSLDGSEPLSTPALQRQRGGLLQAGFCESCTNCTEPACGITEPGCGCTEPACGVCEPGCSVQDPGCGIVEPGCGCDQPECGSCVGCPGPDYICFPVCVPRFKELLFWGGVHGFKGPRDAPNLGGSGDGNFGFQEGLNIGGRAPLVGLLFPQISYQLGYQSVQSQLSGRSNGDTNDRLQHFVTAGFFRRVPVGLQFGAVWDFMRDDFLGQADFNQVRYEISLKGASGLEAGFWGATHTNDVVVSGFDFQAVDQYDFFLRYHFPSACEARFWGGFTNDQEAIFGGDFYTPFNNRWSLQSGFNYLIPQDGAGQIAAQNESWNISMNLVWHYGNTAKASGTNPHRPLFTTADNGTMFVDERP
jgi:hypothetical protein